MMVYVYVEEMLEGPFNQLRISREFLRLSVQLWPADRAYGRVRMLSNSMTRRRKPAPAPRVASAVFLLFFAIAAFGTPVAEGRPWREQLIPILGVTIEKKEVVGTIAAVRLSFEERTDHAGLAVHFLSTSGRFSPMAQTAAQEAIYRTAKAAGLNTDCWTVILSVPEPGLTIYGESLSAMIGLSVVALAKGDLVPPDRVITGRITPDGHIGSVTAVPLKVRAAEKAHIRRVLVPEEMDLSDGDWRTPFLLQVSPVSSISQAYTALTDHPLLP